MVIVLGLVNSGFMYYYAELNIIEVLSCDDGVCGWNVV